MLQNTKVTRELKIFKLLLIL